MPKSNYYSTQKERRSDITKAVKKVEGAKKPKPKKMSAKGKKSPTGSSAIGGMGGGG